MLNPLQTELKLLHMQIKKAKSPVAVALTGYIRFFVMSCITVDDKRYICLIQVVACAFMKLPTVMHHN